MATETTQTQTSSAGGESGTTTTAATTSTQTQTTDTGKQGGVQSAGQTGTTATATGTTLATGEAAKPELELKVPEAFQKDEASLTQFKAMAKEAGLTSAQAQRMLDESFKNTEKRAEEAKSSRERQHNEWREASKADKEYGGANFEQNRAIAQKALVKFGSEAFSKFLDESGLGNHPELLRAFYRAGKAIAEDSVAGASSPAAGQMTDEQRQAVWFPTMSKTA